MLIEITLSHENGGSGQEGMLVQSAEKDEISFEAFAVNDRASTLASLVHSRWRRTYGGNAHQTGRRAIIDGKRFEGNLVFLRARGPASLLDRYRRFREKV